MIYISVSVSHKMFVHTDVRYLSNEKTCIFLRPQLFTRATIYSNESIQI